MYSQKGSPVSGGPFFFEAKATQALIMRNDSFNSISCRSKNMDKGKSNKNRQAGFTPTPPHPTTRSEHRVPEGK